MAEEDAKGEKAEGEKAEGKKKALEKEHLKKGTVGGRKPNGCVAADGEKDAGLQGGGGRGEHKSRHS